MFLELNEFFLIQIAAEKLCLDGSKKSILKTIFDASESFKIIWNEENVYFLFNHRRIFSKICWSKIFLN